MRSFFIGFLIIGLYQNTASYYKMEQNMTWYKLSQQISDSTYTVAKGDSLSGIAKKMLNDINRWPEIQKLNNIDDPNKIQPGQIIKLPQTNIPLGNYTQKEKNKSTINAIDIFEELKKEISSGEGNYYSYNRGVAGDTPKPKIDITKLTVGQIMKMQNTSGPDKKRLLFAVGKYQMIPSTLAEAIKHPKVGVTVNDLFTPEIQEKLFMYLLYKRTNLMAYIEGKSNNIDAAINDLAAEFASLPTTSGKGRYDKDKAGNMASGGLSRVERIKSILNRIRQ